MVAREAPREYRVDYKEALGSKGLGVICVATRGTRTRNHPTGLLVACFSFVYIHCSFRVERERKKKMSPLRTINCYDVPILSVLVIVPPVVTIGEIRRDEDGEGDGYTKY